MQVGKNILVILTIMLYINALLPLAFSSRNNTEDLRKVILQVQKLAKLSESSINDFPTVFKDSLLYIKGLAGYDVFATKPSTDKNGEKSYLLIVQKLSCMLSSSCFLSLSLTKFKHIAQQDELPIPLCFPPDTPPPISILM